jgi:negative regulator of sigma E activity
MKKLILMIMLVAGISVLANAQTTEHKGGKRAHKTPEQRAQRMTKVLNEKLNLTADQSAKVNAIFLTKAVQMDSLRKNHAADRKADRQARKTMLVNLDGQLKGVLNADQQTKYTELKAQMKEKMKDRMKHKRGDKAPKAPSEG